MKTEGPIVYGLDIINLQWAVALVQTSKYFGSILKMAINIGSIFMINNSPSFFGPDAMADNFTLWQLETAGNHHAGVSEGTESERHVSNQKFCPEGKDKR